VNALNVAGMPGVRTPPVAISLMALAPPRISSRTAARTASAPSTSRESAMLWPWPPVTVRARPAARIRGPGTRPAATARYVDARAAHPAEIADRGHTGVQVPLRVVDRLDRGEASTRQLLRLLLEVGTAVELEVHVDVDQAWHQRPPGAVDLASATGSLRGSCVRPDPLDPLRPEEDALALPDRPPVEQRDVRHIRRLRHHGIMSPVICASPP
jgi:hypothetical protein